MRLIGRSFRAHPIPHAIAMTGAVLFSVSVVALSRAIAWVTDNVIVPGHKHRIGCRVVLRQPVASFTSGDR